MPLSVSSVNGTGRDGTGDAPQDGIFTRFYKERQRTRNNPRAVAEAIADPAKLRIFLDLIERERRELASQGAADDNLTLDYAVARASEQLFADAALGPEPEPYKLKFIDSATFDAADYSLEWLVRWCLVWGQPAIIGGDKKTLKTSISVDLAVSLASGTPFLGLDKFAVRRRRRVGMLSGESGEAALRSTGRRVCAARGVDLAGLEVLWGFELPQLANPAHVAAVTAGVEDECLEVLIVDPAYLCLLSGSPDRDINAANIFHTGPLLLTLTRACKEAGCMLSILHHARKAVANSFKPLGLEDLSYAGFQEWARQWILLSHREPYRPSTGDSKLWLSLGGSAGHGGLYAVDVHEGVLREDFTGRVWEVTARDAEGVREEAEEGRKATRDKANQAKVMAAFHKLMEKQENSGRGWVPYQDVRDRCRLNNTDAKSAMAGLEDDGTIEVFTPPREKGQPGKPPRGVRWGKNQPGGITGIRE
jgi:hypothetical protein